MGTCSVVRAHASPFAQTFDSRRPQVQSADVQFAQSAPRTDVHARDRRGAHVGLPRFAVLFPPQSPRAQAQRDTTRKRVPHRDRETRLAPAHAQCDTHHCSQRVQAARRKNAHRYVSLLLYLKTVLNSFFSTFLEGRWVVDDYYEDKVLADITEKGLKPGDFVGELADPNAPSAAALAAAELANAQKGDRAGGTQGIYRAGGPTTLFGSAGWGPYSDGPLNAVRKSLLNRDGLNEENWMLVAAQRTAEASAEWAKQRRHALVPYGGIFGATAPSSAEKKDEAGEEERAKGKRQGHGNELDQGAQEQREDDTAAPAAQARKRARWEEKVPRGVYEPHIGIVLCQFLASPLSLLCIVVLITFVLTDRADTQPTRAHWEGLKDSAEKRQVLGGTKAGNGAWALAWVDTVMEFPASEGDHDAGRPVAEERKRLLQLAAADLNP
jgi:hypothetical protein